MLYDIKYETFMFNLEHLEIEQRLNDSINATRYRQAIIGESDQILYEGLLHTIKTTIISFLKAICNFFKSIIDKLIKMGGNINTLNRDIDKAEKEIQQENEFKPTTITLKNFCVNKKYPSMYDLFKSPLKNFIAILYDEFDNFFEEMQKPKKNFINYDEINFMKNAGYLSNFDNKEYFESLLQAMKENGHDISSMSSIEYSTSEEFINDFVKNIFVSFDYNINSKKELQRYIGICKDVLKDTKTDLKSYKKRLSQDKKEIENYINKIEKANIDSDRKIYLDDDIKLLIDCAGKLSKYLQMCSSLTYTFLNINLRAIYHNIKTLTGII